MWHPTKIDAVHALRRLYGLRPLPVHKAPSHARIMPVLDAHSLLIFGELKRVSDSNECHVLLNIATLPLQNHTNTVFFIGAIEHDASRSTCAYAHHGWGYLDMDGLMRCLHRDPARVCEKDCRKSFPCLNNIDAPRMADSGFQLYQGHAAARDLQELEVEQTVLHRLSWLTALDTRNSPELQDDTLRAEIDLVSKEHFEFDAYSYFLLQECLKRYETLAARRMRERAEAAPSLEKRRDIEFDFYGYDTETAPDAKRRWGKSEQERATELINTLERRLLRRRIMSTHYPYYYPIFGRLLKRDTGCTLSSPEESNKCARFLLTKLHQSDPIYRRQLTEYRVDVQDHNAEFYAVPHTYLKSMAPSLTRPILLQSFALCTIRDMPTLICDAFKEQDNAQASPAMVRQAEQALDEGAALFSDAFCDAIRALITKHPDPARLTDKPETERKYRKAVAPPREHHDHKSVAVLLALKAPACIQRMHIQKHIAYPHRMPYMITLRTLGVTMDQIHSIWHPRLLQYYGKQGNSKPENEAKVVLDDISNNYYAKTKTRRIPKSCASMFQEGDCPHSATCKSSQDAVKKCTSALPRTATYFPIKNPAHYAQRLIEYTK